MNSAFKNRVSMGNDISSDEKEEKAEQAAAVLYRKVPLLADVGIDRCLLAYSGLDSTAVLQRNYSSRLQGSGRHLREVGRLGAELLGAVGPMLAAETPFPLAVGIGAVVVSTLLGKILASPGESTVDLLQRIFAEQKENEVRDLMGEYLKRHQMYVFDTRKLQEELQYWERLLSAQLTRLKNAMLRDGHMSSGTLKIWVNGAAFHSQMLIHLARLQPGGSTPARVAICTYQEDLQELLDKYRRYKASSIVLERREAIEVNVSVSMYPVDHEIFGYEIHDRELKRKGEIDIDDINIPSYVSYSSVVQAYVDRMFSQCEQITGMRQYFRDTLRNLDTLIAQRGEFRYFT
ncbi:hypothetical protein MATL_G00115800 [Megalops atlanticus]|uniref:Uncharacterized protein n=1 Tax=Megalops atlanticus TaxID=7932 RepID=A0A9D3Q1D6_MEGAT|nr:hypothetical protein MATL_G00115800 [Megalops atlanticus]